ncbi:MAG: hypothetical protein HY725_18025 [Candidatus Rokubacteria bacterium]|nr:hypothetical protein [Candidatus Rokubacteria bacterium]
MSSRVLGQVLAVVAVIVIAGTGFCLLDADHGAGKDLCHAFLATAIALFAAFTLTPAGHLHPRLATAYRRYPSDLPAPPPKA